MTGQLRAVRIYIDGGARGNPGPAGAGIVIQSADDGTSLFEGGLYLGEATNNVAEYQALLEGLSRAAELGARQAEVLSDSELLVRQMTGVYRVKNARLRKLFDSAQELCRRFRQVRFRHIPRERNAKADELARRAINLRRHVEDAAG